MRCCRRWDLEFRVSTEERGEKRLMNQVSICEYVRAGKQWNSSFRSKSVKIRNTEIKSSRHTYSTSTPSVHRENWQLNNKNTPLIRPSWSVSGFIVHIYFLPLFCFMIWPNWINSLKHLPCRLVRNKFGVATKETTSPIKISWQGKTLLSIKRMCYSQKLKSRYT